MSKKGFSLFVCAIFLITSLSVNAKSNSNVLNQIKSNNGVNTNSHIILYINNAPSISSILKTEGFDVLHKSITDTSLELIVNPLELNLLESRGFNPEILSIGKPFYEIQKEKNLNIFSSVPPGYLDLSDIIDEMNETENSFSSICKVYDLTEYYNLEPTYEGRHIYAMKISDNVLLDEDEPNFLMVSCHHARELVTPVIALNSINHLTINYGSNPDVTAAVNNYEIWISPVWNVDGYEYVFNVDNYWRKNRHPYSPGIGVDINRNYPFGWYSSGSGSTDPTSEEYKGPSPASEAETQTMMAFGNDRHFAKVLDYHSYGREVLYGYLSLSHPFQSFFQSEAVLLSTASGYGGSIRVPSADGENFQWHLAYNGSYANLIETHTDFQPTYSSALSEAEVVWPGALWMLKRPISVSGHVVDSISQEPLVAEIKLNGISFPNGEKFFSEPRFGRYHLFLPIGTYSIEFSCENYVNQIQEVTVTQTSAELLDVLLERINEGPNRPTIDGPVSGKPGIVYNYTFNGTDPNEDDLEYYIKWGDGNNTNWIGPYSSGEEITLGHSWAKEGTYIIFAKVRDAYGEESSSGSLEVSIPRNRVKTFNSLLHRLIQSYPNLFALLRNLLKLS
jgi:hypothetical protein